MSTNIQKYEPMIQVTCKDGRILLFPKSKEEMFNAAMKDKDLILIPIEGVRINKYEIKYVEDLPRDFDVLIGQPEDVRIACLERFKRYENNLGKKPDREYKAHILQKILKERAKHV